MRVTRPQELEAILRLDGPARLSHFIKRVADEERAWALWDHDWMFTTGSDGNRLFPIWPAREYAERWAVEARSQAVPREVALSALMAELTSRLKTDHVRPDVFPTPQHGGVVLEIDELRALLERELERY